MNYLLLNRNKNKIGLPPNKRYRLTPLARHKARIDLGIAIFGIGKEKIKFLIYSIYPSILGKHMAINGGRTIKHVTEICIQARLHLFNSFILIKAQESS